MKPKLRRQACGPEGGFILVLALSMMAFILLLVLSMGVFIRVESQASSISLQRIRAKEAARTALMMALGELQKHAGPDQRVTARAEITGIINNNRFWTGVWDTTNPTAGPKWLVSGDTVTPSSPIADMMKLVGAPTVGVDSDAYVYAPAIEIPGHSGQQITRLAWWISDEGVKASAGLIDRSKWLDDQFLSDFSPAGLPPSEQKQILQQIAPSRHRIETLFGDETGLVPDETEDITQTVVADKIDEANSTLTRIIDRTSLLLAEGIGQPELQTHFHDITYLAKAVLADTDAGGLKRDLSDRNFEDQGFPLPINSSSMDFLWSMSPDSAGNLSLTGLSSSEIDQLSEFDPVPTVSPILTEIALYFVVSGQSANSRTARAFLRLEAEVWAPHGFRHAYQGASGSDSPEVFVEFENLPDIELTFYDKDTESFTNSTTLEFDEISPSFELDLTGTHKAGEIRKTVGTWPANASSNQSNFYYTSDWSWAVTDPSYNSDHRRVSFPDGDSVRYDSEPAAVNIVLKNVNGEILQKIENIPIDSIEADFGFYEDSPSSLSTVDAPIAFYYRMRDERFDLEKWLGETDPRAIRKDLSNPELLSLTDLGDVDGNGRGDADIPPINAFSNIDLLHGQANNNFFRLYDTPATVPYSLGALTFLQFLGARPFSVGNSWGGDLNSIFDAFFISGIPNDSNTSYWSPKLDPTRNPLPNPFLEVIDRSLELSEINNADSASHLFKVGSFNVNSTSERAWLAVLSANYLYDWDFTLNKGTSSEEANSRINLEAAHFGLPFSGHYRSRSFSNWRFPFEEYEEELTEEDDYPALSDDEAEEIFRNSNNYNPVQDWRPSLQIGHRENRAEALKVLSENIVAQLKGRGEPFGSIREFLNSGILQDSIDETSINTIENGRSYNEAGNDVKIPRFAPAFLSQADVFSAMAPFATVRSDTFTIRALAEIINPSTGEKHGIASCIALVQRTPERVADDENRMENADDMGRKFIIQSIRWVDHTEL